MPARLDEDPGQRPGPRAVADQHPRRAAPPAPSRSWRRCCRPRSCGRRRRAAAAASPRSATPAPASAQSAKGAVDRRQHRAPPGPASAREQQQRPGRGEEEARIDRAGGRLTRAPQRLLQRGAQVLQEGGAEREGDPGFHQCMEPEQAGRRNGLLPRTRIGRPRTNAQQRRRNAAADRTGPSVIVQARNRR